MAGGMNPGTRPRNPTPEHESERRLNMAKRSNNGAGTLYKRGGKGAWIAAWFDHDMKRRTRSTRTTDRAAAARILAKLVADAALRREGVIDARAEAVAVQQRRPVVEHLADWRAHLTAKGNVAAHVSNMHRMAVRLLDMAGAATLADVTATAIGEAVATLKRGGAALRTCNAHIRAVKGFTRAGRAVSVDAPATR